MARADIPLVLFAKAPIPGKVKTRLTTHCTERQAADIAKLLMQASIEKAVSAWPGPIYLSVWLERDHPFFLEMLARYPITMRQQCAGDLGEKMRDALAGVGYPSAVMGCDAPHVKASTLIQAHQALEDGRAVIGPADDGGYYLLGLTECADSLFVDKPWGTSKVLQQTLQSAKRAGLAFEQLSNLNDVDQWSDLLSLAKVESSISDYLSRNKLIRGSLI